MSDSPTIKRRRSRRSESSSDTVLHEPVRKSSRSLPKRLLIPIWLMVFSNLVFLIVGVSLFENESRVGEQETVLHRSANISVFQAAIDDASYTGPERVNHQLLPIEKNHLLKWEEFEGEPWVKVLLWLNEATYQERFGQIDKEENPISGTFHTPEELPTEFVTLVPQVQQFCRRLANDATFQVDYRLKQYLGLNPNHRYARMVELWVPPQDLFRPCPDPETDDRFCHTERSPKGVTVRNIEDYQGFLRKLSLDAYKPDGRPWTRLGYTYDWAYGVQGVGASEYMMIPGARYRFAGSRTTDEYCQQ